jgi:hypothetical protein|tara:strand:+ start:151 stop:393 length:243 start_codon:yes stop_codon:yes gene_type:complete
MRPISVIAQEIEDDWKEKGNINKHARPYLSAMHTLNGVDESYYFETAKSVVLYFLSNATGWRGEKARAIKAELKEMFGVK